MIHDEKEIEEQFRYELPCVNEAWDSMHSELMLPLNAGKYERLSKKADMFLALSILFIILGYSLLATVVSFSLLISVIFITLSAYTYVKFKFIRMAAEATKIVDHVDNQFLTMRKVIAHMSANQSLDNANLQNQINELDH